MPFVRRSVTFRVRSITYVSIDGLPSNLIQMLSSLRLCAVTLTRIQSSKVKVTQDIVRCYKSRTHFPSFFSQNNLDIDLTYTTHNLNNKYPSITCSYIQEYLGYLSNHYFLFSHSWPVVEYNFGQVQHTCQVEKKTKCTKKNNSRGYSRPLDCLVFVLNLHLSWFFHTKA